MKFKLKRGVNCPDSPNAYPYWVLQLGKLTVRYDGLRKNYKPGEQHYGSTYCLMIGWGLSFWYTPFCFHLNVSPNFRRWKPTLTWRYHYDFAE